VKVALALMAFVLVLFPGCALTSRGTASEWQWFTPERVHPRLTSGMSSTGPVIRIRRVTSATDLGRAIVFGDGAYEVGYYKQRRWTESPEHYVRRALERALCQESALRCELDGDAPALDVEVLRFQEVKTANSHAALVSVHFVLSGDHVLLDDTVQVVDPVVGASFDDAVAAIARALEATALEVARRVSGGLS
jgi:cholesterol transport system auxiliary component